MRFKTLTTLFLYSLFTVALSNNYSITGSYLDESLFSEHDTFFVLDECVFSITNSTTEEPVFNSFSWSLQGMNKNSEYVTMSDGNSSLDYHFKLDTTIIPFRKFDSLERFTFENDSSVCFAAKICFSGELTTGEHVDLSVPVYLNLLPSRAGYKIVYYNIILPYGYYSAIGVQCFFERTERSQAVQKEYYENRIMSNTTFPLESDLFETWVDNELQNTFYFAANNGFGTVRSSIMDVNQAISDYLSTTTFNEFHKEQDVLYYPNPVKDVLYLTTDTDDNGLFSIIDVSGKIVKTGKDITNKSVDLTELPSGVYTVTFTNKTNYKLIKIK